MPAVADAVVKNYWCWGYGQNHACTGFTPNDVALFKVLSAGQIKWMLFELSSLVATVKTNTKHNLDKEALIKIIEAADIPKITAWRAAGVKIVAAVQDPGQVMYVPPGWMCAERCTKGVLVYGVRHSTFVRSPVCKSNFETFIGLSGVNEAQLAKLNAVAECMDCNAA